jgi:coproporphyrinogen III oxidase-like Fe-S oxidoreductase
MENHKNVKKWTEAIKCSGCGISTVEKLTREEFQKEIILMGLRTAKGVNFGDVKKYLKINNLRVLFLDEKNLRALEQLGYIKMVKNHCAVPLEHFMILDSIVEKLC